jgi:uncharacterized protein YbaR (Trm112 family)
MSIELLNISEEILNKEKVFNEDDENIYISIPYILKEEAKLLGALYDYEKKKWYVVDQTKLKIFNRVFLNVPFDKKDIAKELGGLWCPDRKKWFTPKFNQKLINYVY